MGNDRRSSAKRAKFKGRAIGHSFFALRHDLLRSEQFGGLSGNAIKLLLFLAAQYNGRNNGNLSMPKKALLAAGWASEATAIRARDELLHADFIRISRHGSGKLPNLFALDFLPVDDCPGKYLEIAAEYKARDQWKWNKHTQNE